MLAEQHTEAKAADGLSTSIGYQCAVTPARELPTPTVTPTPDLESAMCATLCELYMLNVDGVKHLL